LIQKLSKGDHNRIGGVMPLLSQLLAKSDQIAKNFAFYATFANVVLCMQNQARPEKEKKIIALDIAIDSSPLS